MRLLRLVGPGDDGSLILETPDGAEQFSLANDERLRGATRVDLPRIGKIVSEDANNLLPRDIQTRVRGGTDPQTLADESGVPLESLMRFAYPVLQERIRVTDEARRGRARRGSDGPLVPFGALIDGRLSANGVDPATVGWDAFRREDGGWTVTAKFSVYEKQLQAKFSFALINRTVSAADEISGDLLSDRPVRALAPPPPEPVYASDQPEDAPGPVRLAAVPDANEAAEGEPAVARPASRRQKAHTRPVPVAVDDELFDQEALDDGWPEPRLPLDLAEHEPAADAPASQPATRAAVDQKPEVGQGVAEEPQLKRKSGEKPRMPSWDDILLGVRRKSE